LPKISLFLQFFTHKSCRCYRSVNKDATVRRLRLSQRPCKDWDRLDVKTPCGLAFYNNGTACSFRVKQSKKILNMRTVKSFETSGSTGPTAHPRRLELLRSSHCACWSHSLYRVVNLLAPEFF
jgi:hypothetical protein